MIQTACLAAVIAEVEHMSYISNPLMMTQGLMHGEKIFLLSVGKTYAAHIALNEGCIKLSLYDSCSSFTVKASKVMTAMHSLQGSFISHNQTVTFKKGFNDSAFVFSF